MQQNLRTRARLIAALAIMLGSSACRTGASAQEVGRVEPATSAANGEVSQSGDWRPASSEPSKSGAPVTSSAPFMGTRARPSRASFKSRADSISWTRAAQQAKRARGLRIEVSLRDKELVVLNGADTLREAPIAVGMGEALEYAGRRWFFATPRGKRTVLRKEADPVWIPPEWAYAEVAREYGLKLGHMNGKSIRLKDGRILTVRDSTVGVLEPSDDDPKKLEFAALPTDEHIVFDNTLYVPPQGTKNRRIEGELGKYRLDLGEGYLLHGTPHQDSIGRAATHGCVRLLDEDIEWLYENIPVGTAVYIY